MELTIPLHPGHSPPKVPGVYLAWLTPRGMPWVLHWSPERGWRHGDGRAIQFSATLFRAVAGPLQDLR